MQLTWRLVLRVIAVISWLVALGWVIEKPGFEPLLAFLNGIAFFLGSFAASDSPIRSELSLEEQVEREKRLRKAMLDQVRTIWIRGFLENNLHEIVLIELGLSTKHDAIEYPWSLTLGRPNWPNKNLPAGTRAIDVYHDLNGSMLILGEPGSGKTITLLELCRDLLDVAETNANTPIPVVLNLTSWAYKRLPMIAWVVKEINEIYHLNEEIARKWITSFKFCLLLDGLDEVDEKYQIACIEEINQFLKDFGITSVVVCARTADYERIDKKIKLRGAIMIQPLNLDQVYDYLERGDDSMSTVRLTLDSDVVLQEMARTPLNLSIIALTYKEKPLIDIQTGTIEERRKKLFDNYVSNMFDHRSFEKSYSQKRAIHWLAWLANRMKKHSLTVLSIDHIQPYWLYGGKRIKEFILTLGLVELIIGVFVGFILGALSSRIIIGLVVGLMIGLLIIIGSLSAPFQEIRLVENISLRRSLSDQSFFANLISGLIIGILFGQITGIGFVIFIIFVNVLFLKSDEISSNFLTGYLAYVVLSGLYFASSASLKINEIERKTNPNQGIWLSVRNSLIIGFITGMAGYIFGWLIGGHLLGLTFAILFGILNTLIFGGFAFIKHYVLRFVLMVNGYLPGKLAHFLDNMDKLIILRKVGGSYVFIHRMLLEYFASLESWPEDSYSRPYYLANRVNPLLKMIFDYTFGIIALIGIAPMLFLIGLAIKLETPGPIICRRRVLGRNGRQFDAYKFRTTYVNDNVVAADNYNSEDKLAHKHNNEYYPRLTQVGKFLRRSSLDELPQIFNVLLRDMSLVGPRIITPNELAEYGDLGHKILSVPPGVTGLWQVSPNIGIGEDESSIEERIRLDLEYISEWTILLDMRILLNSINVALGLRNSYY